MIAVVGDPSTGTSLTMAALAAGGAPMAAVSRQQRDDEGFHYWANNDANHDPMRLRQLRDQRLVLKVFPDRMVRCLRKAIIPTHAIVTRRPLIEAMASRARRFPDSPEMLAIDGTALDRAVRLLRQAHVAVLEVQFHDVIDRPGETCEAIATFLGPVLGALDVDAMARVPDPALRHHGVPA